MDGLSKETFISAFVKNDSKLQAEILWDLFAGLYEKVDALTDSRKWLRRWTPYLIIIGSFVGGFTAFFTERFFF